jgi:hypothetical protein
VLIMSQIELGIEPIFWGEQTAEPLQPEPIKEVVNVVPSEQPAQTTAVRQCWQCVGA